MTPDGPLPDQVLSACHRRFPDRQCLWAGPLRLWRVELAVRSVSPSLLSEWIAKAFDPGRLGLPRSIVASVRTDVIERRSFAFLDLPAGPLGVPVPDRVFDPWPEATGEVPATVLRPADNDVVPLTADWRTVPVIRAELVPAVAVQIGDAIEMYTLDAAGEVEETPLWRLPAGAFTG